MKGFGGAGIDAGAYYWKMAESSVIQKDKGLWVMDEMSHVAAGIRFYSGGMGSIMRRFTGFAAEKGSGK